jgi:DNA polymerase-3 subunit delta'
LEATRDEELQFVPKKEQRRVITQYEDRLRRAERRARTAAIDHALQLTGLYYRDLACVASGAPDLVHNTDRSLEAPLAPAAYRQAIELIEDTRTRLALNVSEDLALEALAYRLGRLLS